MSKESLILLHGALGAKKQLDPLLFLLEKNFEVYSFNFEGHGGVSSERAFSIDLFVQNTLAFMEENELPNAHFFGYSMGGYVALTLASLQPEKVLSIFTYGTKFDWNPEGAANEVRFLDPTKIEEKIPQYAAFLKELHYPLDWKELLVKTAKMMLQLGENPILVESVYTSITTKISIGIGSNDQMVSVSESRKIADYLPNGEILVFDSMPHPIDKIDTVQMAQTIADFIK